MILIDLIVYWPATILSHQSAEKKLSYLKITESNLKHRRVKWVNVNSAQILIYIFSDAEIPDLGIRAVPSVWDTDI